MSIRCTVVHFPHGPNCEVEHMSEHDEQEPYDWGFELASLIEIRRTEGNVYMDGSHNPRPSEEIAAREFVERIRADERAGWGTGDRWRHVQRVQRETRHHVAGLLASEPAERIREADGREFIALADAQRIARGDT